MATVKKEFVYPTVLDCLTEGTPVYSPELVELWENSAEARRLIAMHGNEPLIDFTLYLLQMAANAKGKPIFMPWSK